MNPKKALVYAFLFGIVMSIPVSNVQAQALELDATAEVWDVIDGDTFDAFPVGRIRLADINAPESTDIGYKVSKNYLEELIGGRQIFLDVDDINIDDSNERLICVVYVRKNSIHLWNVNKKMTVENYAKENDFTNNEFDPKTWKEIVFYPNTDLPERYYPQLLSDYIQLTKCEQSLGLYQPLFYLLIAVSVILVVILVKQKL